jgi:hypothetical protein
MLSSFLNVPSFGKNEKAFTLMVNARAFAGVALDCREHL